MNDVELAAQQCDIHPHRKASSCRVMGCDTPQTRAANSAAQRVRRGHLKPAPVAMEAPVTMPTMTEDERQRLWAEADRAFRTDSGLLEDLARAYHELKI